MSEKKEPKKILLTELKKQVEEGMKLKPLAEYYEIPVAQMKRVLKQAGLKIRSFRSPQYVLIDDEEDNIVSKEPIQMSLFEDDEEEEEDDDIEEEFEDEPSTTVNLTPNYNY